MDNKAPMRTCRIEGCTRPHHAADFCRTHYYRNWKHGSPTAGRASPYRDRRCLREGCGDTALVRGLCDNHYKQEPDQAEKAAARKRTPLYLATARAYQKSPRGKEVQRAAAEKYRKSSRFQVELREKRLATQKKSSKRHYNRNKHAYTAKLAKRRAQKLKATPKWLTKDQLWLIQQFYAARQPGFHVDHIVPLQGENVCGLHVPWNLQILPAEENITKSNKFEAISA